MKNKNLKIINDNKKWIIVCICIIVFGIILENIFDNEIFKFDATIFEMIKNIRTPFLTCILKIMTTLGSALGLITISIAIIIIIKNKSIRIAIAINLITVTIINQILKYTIKRARPIENRLIIEKGYSFPSGHSMVSMAFYGLIMYFILKYIKDKKLKNIIIIIITLMIIIIGISRIYLGAHYASDVIGGFAIAIAYLITFIFIYEKINMKK